MGNGYEIKWTDHALNELDQVFRDLEVQWGEVQVEKLAISIEQKIRLLRQNPYLFQATMDNPEIRRVVILKFNSIYYRVYSNKVEILSFYLNRKNPADLDIE